jgi:hypothetical protein
LKASTNNSNWSGDMLLSSITTERITKIGLYDLRRARIGFQRKYLSEKPLYELEQEQIETIEKQETSFHNTSNRLK